MATIAFIGLGNMGAPMSRNLLKAGHTLRVFDIVPEAIDRAVAAGADPATDVADAAQGADVVITMLPAGEHVRDVYLGDSGVLAAAAPGTLLIDSSTIDVATAREVTATAATAGFDMLDAPVSGGVAGAEAATLTFMVGGSPEAFAAATPILQSMGKNIIHTGGPGNGQAAKICNNLIVGITTIAVAEAFVLAEKLGLSHQTLFDVASHSSGQCWALTTNCPVPGPVPTSPANRDYRPGFAAPLMLKDLRLAQSAATDLAVSTPLAVHAASLFAEFVQTGGQNSDFSGIINMLRSMTSE